MTDPQVLAEFLNCASQAFDDPGIEFERPRFIRRTSSLAISAPSTFSQSPPRPSTLTTILRHLDTAFEAFGTLNNAGQQQLSDVYMESYHKKMHGHEAADAVEFLLRSVCIDELFLGKISLPRSRSRNSCTAAPGVHQRNLLLEASAGRLVLLHEHTGDCHYLYRALGNLRAAAMLDHGDAWASRREFHLRITKATMVVHRRIYEAICGYSTTITPPCFALRHLRKAINIAGRLLSHIKNSCSVGGSDDIDQLSEVLSNALTWILELQSSASCNALSIGRHLMHLTRPLSPPLLSRLLHPLPTELTADHLLALVEALGSRYEALPNAFDAKRCLEVAMTLLQCAVDHGGDINEVDAEGFNDWIDWEKTYLTLMRRLRGYWVRRFGEEGIGKAGRGEQETEARTQERMRMAFNIGKQIASYEPRSKLKVEPIKLAVYLRGVAMQRLHDYTYKSDTGDEKVDPNSGEAEIDDLNDALKIMRLALDIARKIHLGTTQDYFVMTAEASSSLKPPNLATWTHDLRRFLLAKLQVHIDQSISGCTEVQQIAEEELRLNRNPRVVRADRSARIAAMGTVAWILFMLYQAEPEEKVDYLDKAIRLGRDVLDLTKTIVADPDGTGWGVIAESDARNALSMFYQAEYERTRDLRALQWATTHTRKSLKSRLLRQQTHGRHKIKPGVSQRFPTLDTLFEYLRDVSTLASIFDQRYRKTGELTELKNAIKLQRETVMLAAPDRIVKATYQATLAKYLQQLCESQRLQTQAQQEKVLNEALDYARAAWEVLECNGEMDLMVTCLNALCSIYKTRYSLNRIKYAKDLEDANNYMVENQGIYMQPGLSKTGMAQLMITHSEILSLSGGLQDTKINIFIVNVVIQWYPRTLTSGVAELNYRLGVEMSKIPEDYAELDIILDPLKKCLQEPSAAPATRLKAALKICNLLKEVDRWEDVYDTATKAIDLFSLAVLRSLPQADQQKCLEAFSGFGSLAAAAALEAKESAASALILLEKGRDIIAGHRFETRVDLTELRRVDEDLAEEFEKLRSRLDPSGVHAYMMNTGRSGDFGFKDPSGSLLHANRRLEEVVDRIRSKEGFKDFLRPPGLEKMQEAAGDGAIVAINIADWRCDAFIVRKSQEVESIRLDKLTQKAIQQLGDAPSPNEIGLGIANDNDLLEFLWQSIGHPVLTKLGYTIDLSEDTPVESYPRVWWCSTGNASRLPVHAATSWMDENFPEGSVMRRVVSSYTSSIKALIFSRQQAALRASREKGSRALLCSVESTLHDKEWGLGQLLSAPGEVEEVRNIITELMSTYKPTRDKLAREGSVLPAKLNVKIETDPFGEDLLDHFTIASLDHFPPPPEEWPAIFHFAGHGVTNPVDPSKSCLYTKDSPLYVEELVKVGMYERAPLLAYLSACSTGVNAVNRKTGLGDEGIHVMGALQLAGFVGVLGALWRVPDDTASRLARRFYRSWIEGNWEEEGRMARCFHEAIMSLRNTTDRNYRKDRIPANWAPFIHMGV